MRYIEVLIYYSILAGAVFAGPKLFGIPNNITTNFYGGMCMMFGMAYSFYYMYRTLKEPKNNKDKK